MRVEFERAELLARHHLRGDGGDRIACRLRHERHGARGSRIDLEQIDCPVLHGELDVHEASHFQRHRELLGLPLKLPDDSGVQRVRRQRARAVARMDPRKLDVLHHARDADGPAVAQGVDIHLHGVGQELVDQDRIPPRRGNRVAHVLPQLRWIPDDFHGAAAKHVGGPDHDRVADLLGRPRGFVGRMGRAVPRLHKPEPVQKRLEPLPILGEVDGVRLGSENPEPVGFNGAGKLQRSLASELDDRACQLPGSAFGREDFRNMLVRQRFEIQPVRRVVVGRNCFRIAIDHDGLEARRRQGHAGMAAAVVEFDALADSVRPPAEDRDFPPVRWPRLAFGFAVQRGFVSRVHVRRSGVEFGGARVYPLEDRPDAETPPERPHLRRIPA